MLSDKETIEACVTKAIEGGWRPFWAHGNIKDYKKYVLDNYAIDEYGMSRGYPEDGDFLLLSDILFDHDFARALWGEGYEPDLSLFENKDDWEVVDGKRCYMTKHDQQVWDSRKSGWQYHLQKLAISTDRIAYLRENA